jgi:hypothetical protein
MNKTRSAFTHSAILAKIRGTFKDRTQRTLPNSAISLTDCLMSGLAIFSLKLTLRIGGKAGQKYSYR